MSESTPPSPPAETPPDAAADVPRVVTTRVRWSWLNGPVVLAFLMLYMLAGFPIAIMVLRLTLGSTTLAALIASLPLLSFLVTQVYSAELRAGADGVLLRWFGTTRYLPYQDIRRCTALRDNVDDAWPDGRNATVLRLELRSGRAISLRAGGFGANGGRIENGADVVVRIRNGIEAAANDTTDDAAAQLARGERPVKAWLEDLAHRARSHGYRDAALDRDELLHVVASTLSPPTARVGAAAILRKSGIREEERRRLRIAAESSVAPQVRIALEAAAAADLEERAVDEALASVARGTR